MPKHIKLSEDIARLKEIKKNVADSFYNLKALKETIKSLKAERKTINAKYVKQNVSV